MRGQGPQFIGNAFVRTVGLELRLYQRAGTRRAAYFIDWPSLQRDVFKVGIVDMAIEHMKRRIRMDEA